MEIKYQSNTESNEKDYTPNNESISSGSYFEESDQEMKITPSEEFSFFEVHNDEEVRAKWSFNRVISQPYNTYKLDSFYNFIDLRKDYLDTLENLDNWISGTNSSPTRETINNSKYILDFFRNWISAQQNYPIPKIVMGPMPEGGVTLEFRPNSSNGMFISISNNSEIEIDVMVNNTFYSLEKSVNQVKPYMLEAYEHIVNERDS